MTTQTKTAAITKVAADKAASIIANAEAMSYPHAGQRAYDLRYLDRVMTSKQTTRNPGRSVFQRPLMLAGLSRRATAFGAIHGYAGRISGSNSWKRSQTTYARTLIAALNSLTPMEGAPSEIVT
jgi:hypothetical protein